MELNKEKAEKVKRFDDAFRMLLMVMTITTSIGLSTYTGLNLWVTLLYFVMPLVFWVLGHLVGSNPLFDDLEIVMKITAWVLALLMTTSTFAKFALKAALLESVAKIPIVAITSVLTFATYCWFGDLIPSYIRRKYLFMNLTLLLLFFGGYFTF